MVQLLDIAGKCRQAEINSFFMQGLFKGLHDIYMSIYSFHRTIYGLPVSVTLSCGGLALPIFAAWGGCWEIPTRAVDQRPCRSWRTGRHSFRAMRINSTITPRGCVSAFAPRSSTRRRRREWSSDLQRDFVTSRNRPPRFKSSMPVFGLITHDYFLSFEQLSGFFLVLSFSRYHRCIYIDTYGVSIELFFRNCPFPDSQRKAL